MKMSPDTR